MTLESSSVSKGCAQFKIGFLLIAGAFGINECVGNYSVTGMTWWCNILTVCWCRAMGMLIVCGCIAKADGSTTVFTWARVVQADEVVQMASEGHNVNNSKQGKHPGYMQEKHHKA